MSFDHTTLITDRAEVDVEQLLSLKAKNYADMTDEEQEVWNTALKGAYTASDLNRITAAMVYLKGVYEQYGYQVDYTPVNITHSDGTTDTVWRVGETPTISQGALIVQNLRAFWAGIESAAGNVVEVWADTSFGYVEMSVEVSAGSYVSVTDARGIVELVVTVQGKSLESIEGAGTGWTVEKNGSVLTARYTVQQGVFRDIQDALDTLVFLCSAEKFADVSVTVSAVMRSGSTVEIGSGAIHWSNIINWEAFEAYAYTWQDVENAQMTWEDLESLPIPRNGGTT